LLIKTKMKIYHLTFLLFFVMTLKESYGCEDPLGMESGEIKDSQITASSYDGKRFNAPSNARLHMQPVEGKSGGAWASGSSKSPQWVQIDLGAVKKVTAIATQGHPDKKLWIKTYQILYGNDRNYLAWYGNWRLFTGNTDRNSVVKHILNPPVEARYIVVMMKSWQWWPAMRIELYGCAGNYNVM
ncbi:hypothetical protein QZH41_015610, partial [Actinostola sp. cb2023]